MRLLLLDTCILIDLLRSYRPAIDFLRNLEQPTFLSIVSVAELHVGARTGAERAQVEALIRLSTTFDVDADIARRAGWLRRTFRHSHGLDLLDALIAATAEMHGLRLVTRNVRNFPMLDDVLVPYQ